jgi:hypothetical protein
MFVNIAYYNYITVTHDWWVFFLLE